jgi:hypothetical protein
MPELGEGILDIDWPSHSKNLERWTLDRIVALADPGNRACMTRFGLSTGRRGDLVAIVLAQPTNLDQDERAVRAGAALQAPGTKLTLGTGRAIIREHYRYGTASGEATAIGVDTGLDAAAVRAVLWHHVRLEFHG